MSEEMKKMKYDDFIKSIVNRTYDTIDMESDLLENGKKPTFKIILTRGEWITRKNYQSTGCYYDFDIDDIINLILDLFDEQNEQIKNRLLSVIKRNNDALLKELENDD